MFKIEQNWGKIANYPPQCSTKIGNPALTAPSSEHNPTTALFLNKTQLSKQPPTCAFTIYARSYAIQNATL